MAMANTLSSISLGLGLHRDTLRVTLHRANKRGEDGTPEPVAHVGINERIPVYDVLAVESWYAGRGSQDGADR